MARRPGLARLALVAAAAGLVAVALLPWLQGGGAGPLAPAASEPHSASDGGGRAEQRAERPAENDGLERVSALPVAVRGRVVDEHGTGIEGVEVSLKSLDVLPGQEPPPRIAVSGPDGALEFTGPIGVRRHRVGVVSPAWERVGNADFAIDRNEPDRALTVVVRGLTPVGGVVVGEGGEPLQGVRLRARGDGRKWAEGATDAAGRFTLWAGRRAGEPAEVQLYDTGAHQPVELDGVLRWGQRDATIRLPQALAVVVRAVAADSGQPVEEFAVRSRPARRPAEEPTELRLGGRHADGEVLVDGLWEGVNYLQVVPSDPLLAPSDLLSVAAGPGAEPVAVQVPLARRRALRVRCRTADGRPVEGALMELIDPRGRAIAASTHSVDPVEVELSPSLWRRKVPRLCTSAETRADGAAVLRAPVDGRALVLRATRANMEAVLREIPAVAPLGDEIEIVIPAWGRVRGTLRPVPPASWGARLALSHLDKRGVRRTAEIDRDGRFDVDELQAGTFGLVLDVPAVERPDGTGPPRVLGSLGDVLVVGGEDRAVELDGSRFRPARLLGQVLFDGAPARGAVFLVDSGRRVGPFSLDDAGRFDSGPQIAANATLLLRRRAGRGQEVEYLHGKAIVLRWGQEQERSFHFAPHTLRVRLQHPDGTPAEGVRVAFNPRVWTEPRVVWTDRDGIAELDHAPYTRVFVRVRTSTGRDATLGELDLSADEPLREVEYVLAERRE